MAFITIGGNEAGSCLPEAVPERDRQNLTNSLGETYPIGLMAGNLDSNKLLNMILSILFQDVLGYNTVVDRSNIGAEGAIYALAGCEQFEIFEGCSGRPARYHIYLSALNYDRVALELDEDMRPVTLGGGMSYETISSLYISGAVNEDALQSEGLSLTYYLNWNASWFQPGRYFDKITDIPTSGLIPCHETFFGNPAFMASYLAVSGDFAGVFENGTGICPDGYWFLAPSCRANASQCVPALTYNTPRGREVEICQNCLPPSA